MHKNFILIIGLFICICFFQNASCAQALIGEISKEEFKLTRPQVIDSATKSPISGATVFIPTENKFDHTDNNGHFKITPKSNKPVILSVQKEGYRPFSLTVQDGILKGGLLIEMEKKSPFSFVVTDNLLHLGDDSYSDNSAGACQINAPCVGPTFTKDFHVATITPKTKAYVTIGSIIGLDTIQAMKLGQNNLTNATSTPLEIFVNKNKIGELKINGDNQKIPIPTNILKKQANNTLTIKTGINKNSDDNIDYDDVELMNLIVDIQN